MAALIGFLLVGAVAAAVFNARTIEGSVPGRAPILGVAEVDGLIVIGTSQGVFASPDGKTWSRIEEFEGMSLVAGLGEMVVVHSGNSVWRVLPDGAVSRVGQTGERASALAVTAGGSAYVAQGSQTIEVFGPGGQTTTISSDGRPSEVLALAVGEGEDPALLAGGLSSGLWRSTDGGGTWTRILGTPIRAVLADTRDSGRVFIGTAGGVLFSTPTDSWEFTGLRLAVEALAEGPDGYIAVTADRLIYDSTDGIEWRPRFSGDGDEAF